MDFPTYSDKEKKTYWIQSMGNINFSLKTNVSFWPKLDLILHLPLLIYQCHIIVFGKKMSFHKNLARSNT